MLKNSLNKYLDLFSYLFLEREVTVTNYNPQAVGGQSQIVNTGCAVEVRGVATGESELQFGDLNRFDGDFDMGSYEQMLDYYHGMCKHLCVQEVM